MTPPGPRTVTVTVVVTEPVATGGVVRVVIEDVSRVDASAPIIAAATRPMTGALKAGARLTVELVVLQVDERASYNVRAHLDISGSGGLSSGDRITTRAYPVLTRGAPDHVDVEVVPI